MSRYGDSSYYGDSHEYRRQSRSSNFLESPIGGSSYTTTYRTDYSKSDPDYISRKSRHRAWSASPGRGRLTERDWSTDGFSARNGQDSGYWDYTSGTGSARGNHSHRSAYDYSQDYQDNCGGGFPPMTRSRSLVGLSDCDCVYGHTAPRSYGGGYDRPTIASMRKSQNFLPLPPLRQHLNELYITDDGNRVTGIGDRDSHTPMYVRKVGDTYEGRLLAPSRRRLWTAGRVGWRDTHGRDYDFYDYIDRSGDSATYEYNKYHSNPYYQSKTGNGNPFSSYNGKRWKKEVHYGRDGTYGGIRSVTPGRYESNTQDYQYDYSRTPGALDYMDGQDDWYSRTSRYGNGLAKQSYKW